MRTQVKARPVPLAEACSLFEGMPGVAKRGPKGTEVKSLFLKRFQQRGGLSKIVF